MNAICGLDEAIAVAEESAEYDDGAKAQATPRESEAALIGYVEIGAPETRRIGFGTL